MFVCMYCICTDIVLNVVGIYHFWVHERVSNILFFLQLFLVCYIYLAEYRLFIFSCISILDPHKLHYPIIISNQSISIIMIFTFSLQFSVVNFQFSSTKHVFVHPLFFGFLFKDTTPATFMGFKKHNQMKNIQKKTKNTIYSDFRYGFHFAEKSMCSLLFFACLNYCHHIYSMHFERTFNQMDI